MPTTIFSLCAATLVGGALEAPVTSATLYGDRARLVRTTDVEVEGRARIELPLLPAEVDPGSVRVEVDAGREIAVEAVEVARVAPAERAGPDAIAAAARGAIDDELAAAEAERNAIARAAQSATKGPTPPPEAAPWPLPPAERWRRTLAFLSSWTAELDERRAAVEARIADLRARRAARADEAARAAAGEVGRVRVVVGLAGRGRGRLAISYTIAGPSWTPRYEVRLDPARDEVALTLAASARQETGEGWVGAALAFSTATPRLGLELPDLPRWRLGARARFVPRTPAPEPAPPEPTARTGAAAERDRRLAAAEREAGEEGGVVAPDRGTLRGDVFDQTGQPLSGVRIRATSRTQIGGAQATRTNAEGQFRLGGLSPGLFEVVASAPGRVAVVQKDVEVRPHARAEISFVLEVAEAKVEQVKVLERPPTVSTVRATSTEVYDGDFTAAPRLREARAPGPSLSLAPPAPYSRLDPPGSPAALADGRDLLFPAPSPEELPSAPEPARVPLRTWRYAVTLERQLVPAVRPEAFVVAALRSPAGTPLPGGPAALFVGGEPVGEARLPLLRPAQPFRLPLGLDRAVRASRHVRLDEREEGLLRKAIVVRYTVTIDAANPHPRPVPVEIVDQVPRARGDAVEVRLERAPPGAALDPARGAISWRATLAAAGTARFSFVYAIRRPKGQRLGQEGMR